LENYIIHVFIAVEVEVVNIEVVRGQIGHLDVTSRGCTE
jgi:hypothetical protein